MQTENSRNDFNN